MVLYLTLYILLYYYPNLCNYIITIFSIIIYKLAYNFLWESPRKPFLCLVLPLFALPFDLLMKRGDRIKGKLPLLPYINDQNYILHMNILTKLKLLFHKEHRIRSKRKIKTKDYHKRKLFVFRLDPYLINEFKRQCKLYGYKYNYVLEYLIENILHKKRIKELKEKLPIPE